MEDERTELTVGQRNSAVSALKNVFQEGVEVIEILENSKIVDESGEYLTEAKELSLGIFWVITETRTLDDYKLLAFDIPCDMYGNHQRDPDLQPNAKSGKSYNHKLLWEEGIKGNSKHRPYNKKEYNYYPRGRVEISNNKAKIFLNPHINVEKIINNVKHEFGLNPHNIPTIEAIVDGSTHYQCFIDWEDENKDEG
jgi:hypothetical protein